MKTILPHTTSTTIHYTIRVGIKCWVLESMLAASQVEYMQLIVLMLLL